ncbi:MAG: transcriptional regulator [Candidatus Thermoplasmatota archaeon]|nr:transcriptional regulator [Candidatus Thermoplasmatota archaeon]
MEEETKINIPQDNTRTEILKHLLGVDLTALDLKEKIGINENAIRKHLDKLENRGFIEHHFEKASRGRPKKYFELTKKGKDLFPKHEIMLLNALLEKVEEEKGEEELEYLFKKASEELQPFFKIDEDLEFDKKIEELAERFNEFNFFCTASKEDARYEMEYRNCVFSGVSEEYAEYACMVHDEIVRSSLKEEIGLEHGESILENGDICTHIIRPEPESTDKR